MYFIKKGSVSFIIPEDKIDNKGFYKIEEG